MTGDPIDFNKHRFERAKNATDITPIMALREVLRKIEAGELSPTNVAIVSLIEEDGDTYVHIFTGGPATRNEHVGMLYRATNVMVNG